MRRSARILKHCKLLITDGTLPQQARCVSVPFFYYRRISQFSFAFFLLWSYIVELYYEDKYYFNNTRLMLWVLL